MSSENVRNLVHQFEECHTRIQTLGEVLLISCKPRPVFVSAQDLELTSDNFVRFRDRVISNLNKMCIISKDISSQIHTERLQMEKQLNQPLMSLSATMVTLTQLASHIAYLMAVNTEGSQAASLGSVASQFELVQADLELKFVCNRLKRSHVHDLTPHMLVEMCATITKSLSCIADMCKDAADKISDTQEQDQFKLCIKAITSTTGCLVSSVKSLKSRRQQQQQHHHHQHHHHHHHQDYTSVSPSTTGSVPQSAEASHLQRVVNFCLPVTATSTALTAFATEDKFLGSPASLSLTGENVFKSILGLCMSMLSASLQILKSTRDLLYDPTKRKHKDKITLCVDSISRTAFRLRDFLLSYEFSTNSSATTRTISGASPSSNNIPSGEDKLNIVMDKDGEISTPFYSSSNSSSSCVGNSNSMKRERKEECKDVKVNSDEKIYQNENDRGVTLSSLVLSSPSSSSSPSTLPSTPKSISATSVINYDNIYSNNNNIDHDHGRINSSTSSPSSKLFTTSPSVSPKLSSKSKSSSSSISDSKKKQHHHHHHHHHRKSSTSSSKQFSIPVEPSHSSLYAGAQSHQAHQARVSSQVVKNPSTLNQSTKESALSPSPSSPHSSPIASSTATSPSPSTSPLFSASLSSPTSSSSPSNTSSGHLKSSSASSSLPLSSPSKTSPSGSDETLDSSKKKMKEEFVLSVDVLGDIVHSERL